MCISVFFELIFFSKKSVVFQEIKRMMISTPNASAPKSFSDGNSKTVGLVDSALSNLSTTPNKLQQPHSSLLILFQFLPHCGGKKKSSLKEIPQHLRFDACFSSCRRDSTTLVFCGDDLWRFFWHPIVGITLHQPLDFIFKTHWWHSGGKSWGRSEGSQNSGS